MISSAFIKAQFDEARLAGRLEGESLLFGWRMQCGYFGVETNQPNEAAQAAPPFPDSARGLDATSIASKAPCAAPAAPAQTCNAQSQNEAATLGADMEQPHFQSTPQVTPQREPAAQAAA